MYKNNTTGATCGAATAYISVELEITLGFYAVRVVRTFLCSVL